LEYWLPRVLFLLFIKKCVRGGVGVGATGSGVFVASFHVTSSVILWRLGFRAFTINKKRGGNWNDQSRGGVFALNVNNPRTNVYTNVGFRASFSAIHQKKPRWLLA
jgi:hypothetical protein